MKLPVLFVLAASVAAAATSISVTPDLAYRSGGNLSTYEQSRCRLDVYAPAGAKDLPCLIWLHGGGLTGGDKQGAKTVATARALASEGLVVAAVNYRLSGPAKFPAYIEDTAAAVAWLKLRARDHGGDARRLFVAGHSAGGYLVAMVGLDERWLKPHGLALADIAGLIPLAGQMATHYTIRQERGNPKTRIVVDEAAPLHFVRKDSPPWLILYAEKDLELRADENRYFAEALRVAGHPHVTVRQMAGHDHGGIGDDIAKDNDTVRQAIVAFIRRPKG